nr:MAG TPA: hypothetical protein [Caudoviricetes sp.]
MEVVFYNYTGANNVINKNLGNGTTLNCNMQVATEQLNPHVRVTFTDTNAPETLTYNYCTLTLGDKDYPYFIDTDNVINIGRGVFDVPMQLDLLELYKSDILNSTAIIDRSSSNFNMYLRDDIYQAFGYPIVGCKEFPSGFDNNYTYLLNVFNTLGGA